MVPILDQKILKTCRLVAHEFLGAALLRHELVAEQLIAELGGTPPPLHYE
jgi:hypothetical protein